MRAKCCNALKILVIVRPYKKGLFSYVKKGGEERSIVMNIESNLSLRSLYIYFS